MTATRGRSALTLLTLLAIAGCSTAVPGAAAGPTGPLSTSAADSTAPPTSTGTTVSTESTGTATTSSGEDDADSQTTSARPETTTTMTYGTYPPTDLTGEDYGIITAVDLPNSQITLDRISWFTGADAQQACADDGVTATDNNWCTGYYYRNNNPALRVVAVSPEATISTLVGSRSTPSDLATVATRIATTASAYRLTVTDGVVTQLEEIYQP